MNKNQVYEELDRIYAECKEDGWVEQDDIPATGISLESINQAKEFLRYVDLEITPYVVPYDNGDVGFEWHIDDRLACVNFKDDNQFSYAIVTPVENYYGTSEQNYQNQMKVANRLSIMLESVDSVNTFDVKTIQDANILYLAYLEDLMRKWENKDPFKYSIIRDIRNWYKRHFEKFFIGNKHYVILTEAKYNELVNSTRNDYNTVSSKENTNEGRI